MKRDMDLVRKILLECEQQESGFPPEKLEIEGYSDAQLGYHVHLMGEACSTSLTGRIWGARHRNRSRWA